MVRRLTYLILLAAVVLLGGNLFLRFGGTSVWDDAYFYVRYADHFLSSGEWAWNVGDTAYGLTSPAYGAMVIGLRLLGGDPDLPLLLFSLFFLALSLWVGKMIIKGDQNPHRNWLGLYAGGLMLLQTPALAELGSSGMETLFAASYLGLFLAGLKRFRWGLRRRGLIMGIAGGMAFLIRPELLIFTVGTPVGLALFSKDRRERMLGLYMSLFALFAMVVAAVGAREIFGDLLPLSFQAKSFWGGAYGAEVIEKYRFWALREGAGFVFVNGLAFLGMALAWTVHFKQTWSRMGILDRLLTALLMLFLVYEAFFVLQVMGGAHRFYYPVFLLVAYLGWRTWSILLDCWGSKRVDAWVAEKKGKMVLLGAAAGLVALGILASLWLKPPDVSRRFAEFGMQHVYAELGMHNWTKLEQVTELPADCMLAATELGILGVMNGEKAVLDLTGLNDREVMRGLRSERGMACEYVLEQKKPDLIYLPHPDYKRMTAALMDCGLEAAYHIYSSEKLNSYLGVAVRKDSPYADELREIFEGE